jgi:CRISPR system Cascade subunit CasB
MNKEQNTDVKKQSVYNVMWSILNFLNSPQEQKSRPGYLAAIRNSIGKNFEDATDVWPIIFPFIPKEFLNAGTLSYEEKALIVVLQLYAIGQQGLNKVSNDENNNSFGSSLQRIKDGNSTSLDRRFNTMITATTFDEFVYHLRQIFRLAKSKNNFSVNFLRLADDLFKHQNGVNKKICLRWAKDYYRPFSDDEKSDKS